MIIPADGQQALHDDCLVTLNGRSGVSHGDQTLADQWPDDKIPDQGVEGRTADVVLSQQGGDLPLDGAPGANIVA